MEALDEDLRRWGPGNSEQLPVSLSQAEAYCRRLARTHYENFPVLSWMLPGALRQPVANVYAWCRWADDLADEVADSRASSELLQWWREQLADCYAGTARHPVLVALRPTIEEFELSPVPFEDLISAFEQDQRVRSYESFAQLQDYCRRSANPVGRLVLQLCDRNEPELCDWSDSICTGLQLANFWQDVARDADAGRTYLPRQECAQFGYSPEDLAKRVTNRAFVELMRFQVELARSHLTAGLPLVEHMPGRMQIVVESFARGGLMVLDKIEAIGYRVWDSRPVLGKRDVIALSGRCLTAAVRRRVKLGRKSFVPSTAGVKPSS